LPRPAAVELLVRLAEKGDAEAQHHLGEWYRTGHGVPQDYAEAVKWYRKAAYNGVAIAQYNLGIMYENGKGVPQDHVLAHMWFSLAASSMSDAEKRDAVRNRDIVASKMTPAQISKAQRLTRKWFRRSAYPGLREAIRWYIKRVKEAG
jgi:hypothetical protein